MFYHGMPIMPVSGTMQNLDIKNPTHVLNIGQNSMAFGCIAKRALFDDPFEPEKVKSSPASPSRDQTSRSPPISPYFKQATVDLPRCVALGEQAGSMPEMEKVLGELVESPARSRLSAYGKEYHRLYPLPAQPTEAQYLDGFKQYHDAFLGPKAFADSIREAFPRVVLTDQEISMIYLYCSQTTANPCYSLVSCLKQLFVENNFYFNQLYHNSTGKPLKLDIVKEVSGNTRLKLMYEIYYRQVSFDGDTYNSNAALGGKANAPVFGIQMTVDIILGYESPIIFPKTFYLLSFSRRLTDHLSLLTNLIDKGALKKKHAALLASI